MKETRYYAVAGHVFSVAAEAEHFALMQNYEPFGCDGREAVFALTVGNGDAPEYTEELRQDDDGQVIICGSRMTNPSERTGEAVFEFRWLGETAGWLVCSADYREVRLVTTGKDTRLAIDNALMVMYALATAVKGTVLFHAAIVSFEGRGYMFLGPSGTGKSTHARLWLRYVAGTALVNDTIPWCESATTVRLWYMARPGAASAGTSVSPTACTRRRTRWPPTCPCGIWSVCPTKRRQDCVTKPSHDERQRDHSGSHPAGG